jgi:hypothetical protein
MKNRLAWGLAVVLSTVLAMAVLGGGVLLADIYSRRQPGHQRTVDLLPRDQWGFGHQLHIWMTPGWVTPGHITGTTDEFRCGFIVIYIQHHRPSPPVSAPTAAPR